MILGGYEDYVPLCPANHSKAALTQLDTHDKAKDFPAQYPKP